MKTQRFAKVAAGAAVSSALLLSGAGFAFAQTYGTTGTSTGTTSSSSTTPGVPNTGAGGGAAGNLAILGATAVIAIGGATYLVRKRYSLG